MKTLVYSYHPFEQLYLQEKNPDARQLSFSEHPLSPETVALSEGFDAVSLFTTDDASAPVLERLHQNGIRFIALRSAGYNHVDLNKAKQLGIRVARVPAYSPFAIAEHAVMLMLALNRRVVQADQRIAGQNFSLNGLTGFDMNGKTAGIMGTGKIGSAIARILHGFGCNLLAFDLQENEALKHQFGVKYTDRETLYNLSDIITLHLPLNEHTRFLIDRAEIRQMKPGVMLINTARGALVNTQEVITALKSGQIGYFGMDVYEHEKGLFFEDHSGEILQDDTFARLMAFPNVLITGHQSFLTDTALKNIAETTRYNLECFSKNRTCENELIP